jgi:6,7-dimethyl-8-ribityllumazine synthase
MVKKIEGALLGKGYTVALVASRFNDFITNKLVDAATDTLVRHGVEEGDITVVLVPGAFEIPFVAHKLAASKASYDAVVCLGTIIRGDTPHFDYICQQAAKGIANASQKTGVPVVFGIITADTLEQAIERAGTKSGNKGKDAALTALEMINLTKKIEKK